MDTDQDASLVSPSDDSHSTEEALQPVPVKKRGAPIEIALFAMFIAWNLSDPVFTNQVVFQTCTVTLNKSYTMCKLLGTANQTQEIKDLETQIQPYTANLQMTKQMVEQIIPAFLSLFIGPWSDKFGRKPVIMWPSLGFVLLYLTNAIITVISNYYVPVSPWFFMVGSLFVAFSGGNCALLTGMFAYIADTTVEKNRDFRMGLLEGAIYCGLFVGSMTGGYLFNWTNAMTVFLISSLLLFFTFLFVIFGIRESLVAEERVEPDGSKYRELFRLDLIVNLFTVCFKRRPNWDRAITWMLIGILVALIFSLEGSINVYYLYFRVKLGWTITTFTQFNAFSIVIQFMGVLLGAFVLKKGAPGSALAIIGFISYAVASVVFSLATSTKILYIALGITFMKAVSAPMIRSQLSKAVDPADVGKFFSLTTSMESCTPLIAAPLYTFVYKQTLTTFPGAFFLISAGVYVLCIITIFTVILMRRRSPVTTYVSINNDS